MTDPDEGLTKLTAEEFLRKAVEELGGPNVWDDGVVEFYKAICNCSIRTCLQSLQD